MTSPTMRAAIKGQLAANWTHCPVFDQSDYTGIDEIPVGIGEAMLLIQFVGGPDRIATIGNVENHGWEEQGVVIFHLCFPTGEDSARALQWGEELVFMFRGRRLGDHLIDFMDHFSDFAGAAIRLNGRWHGWSANLGYTSIVCA